MRNRYHNCFASLFCAAALLVETTGSCSQETSNIRQISYGKSHFCAVTTAGELVCWGDNTMGQIGNGKYSRSLPDARVLDPTVILPVGVTAVSAGSYHTCAIASGMLYCWGSNTSGEIGIGRVDPDAYKVLTAKPAMVIPRDVTSVSAGGGHTCAIVAEDLECWGANWSGQIGTGSLNGDTSKPLTIIKGGVTTVAAGEGHTCAVVRDDLWCWGDNRSGQVGNGVMGQNVLAPVKVISGSVSAVVAGKGTTCAIVGGALQCWGVNGSGQLDLGTKGNVLAPKQFIPGRVTAIAMRDSTYCAAVRGALQCWGHVGNNGNLGISTSDYRMRIERPRELIHEGVTAIAMGEQGTCALVNGALRCRGNDPYLNNTIQKSQFAPYSEAKWDIPFLSHARSDMLIAQAKSPSVIADYLKSHRILYHDGVVYYTGQVSADAYAPRQGQGDLSLKLDIRAIPLFQGTTSSSGQNGNDLALVPGATCGLEGGHARTLDSSQLYVWTGDRFTNLHDALQSSIRVLPAFNSPHDVLGANAQDIKRIQDCAQKVAAAIDSVPYKSISYTLHGGQGVDFSAALSRDWANEERGWVEQINVKDKGGSMEGYAARAYTVSAMQCGGTVLSKWKRWQSPVQELSADSTAFQVNSAMLLANARDFPVYAEAELRRAIRAEQGQAGLASPTEARQCLPTVVAEHFEVRHRGVIVQQFSIELPVPQPPLTPDCAQALLCKPLPDAPQLRIALLVPSSFDTRRFGEAKPARNAKGDGDENDPADDRFGMVDDTSMRDDRDEQASPPPPTSYDLGLFVVDSRNGEIYNRFLEKKAYVSAPLVLMKFTLDTGRYLLSPGTRAFGVRAEYADPNSLATQGETTLKLFVREGDTLHKVLDGLLMNQTISNWSGACTGASTRVSRIIDIGTASSHGYADLVVTSTVNVTESRMSGGRCVEKTLPPRTETATLQYDGKQYLIPAALH